MTGRPFDLDDRPVHFSKFKGKPLFLNIWATWCGPCVQEMPSIARLAENPRLKGKGIQFVCISTDESSAAVRRFIDGKNWSMTFLRADRLPIGLLYRRHPRDVSDRRRRADRGQ